MIALLSALLACSGPADPCATDDGALDCRTTLHLGRGRGDAAPVPLDEVEAWLDTEVAPRVTGWTSYWADGGFGGVPETAESHGEPTIPGVLVVEVIHSGGPDNRALMEAIARSWAVRFDQAGVFVVEVPARAWVVGREPNLRSE